MAFLLILPLFISKLNAGTKQVCFSFIIVPLQDFDNLFILLKLILGKLETLSILARLFLHLIDLSFKLGYFLEGFGQLHLLIPQGKLQLFAPLLEVPHLLRNLVILLHHQTDLIIASLQLTIVVFFVFFLGSNLFLE